MLAGLFGIGGGAIIVPVLYEVFRIARRARGGAHAALRRHLDRDHHADHDPLLSAPIAPRALVLPDVLRLWALPAVIGVALGAVIAHFAPAAVFKIAFVVIAAVIATKLLFGRDRWQLGDRSARAAADDGLRLPHRAHLVADGRERRLDLQHDPDALRQADPQAVATSAGLGVPITIAGTHRLHARRLAAPGAAAAAVASASSR